MSIQESAPQTRLKTEGLKARLRRHVSELVRLAAPIVVSRSGFLLLVMADTVMTGHYAASELAYLAIGFGLVMPLMITSLGIIMGTLVLAANAYGAGELARCGEVWRRSVAFAAMLGVLSVAIAWNGEGLLTLTGQTPDIARGGGEIMRILGLGLPGHLLFLSSAFFLEGIGRPMKAMLVMVAANVLNVVLNAWFIDGGMGIPAMGGAGAAWATTATRWFMAASLAFMVWNLRDHVALNIRVRPTGGFRAWRELRRIGYAIGVSVGVESFAFACLNAMAGWLGTLPLAGYGLTINLVALFFMLAIGVGAATTVRVGIAYGRGDAPDAALAGWTGLGASTVLMFSTGLLVWSMPDVFVGIYTDDPALIAEAVVSVAFIIWVFVPDGGQAVMANALRGRKDVWAPSMIQTASFFGVMVPVGYVSAFVLGTGLVGLFHGIFAGCAVSLVCLSIRFHLLARRDMRRMGFVKDQP